MEWMPQCEFYQTYIKKIYNTDGNKGLLDCN